MHYPCTHPTCTEYVPTRHSFCEQHQGEQSPEARRQQQYDLYHRDPEAKRFYNSRDWRRTRAEKLAANPICERCNRVWAEHVHHEIPIKQLDHAQRLDQRHLTSLCPNCHAVIEMERKRKGG